MVFHDHFITHPQISAWVDYRMEDYQQQFSQIRELLRGNPMGMTVSEIAATLKLNRNTAAKYLEMMQFAGHLDMKMFGVAKVYFLSRRIPLSTLLDFTTDQILVLDRNFTIIQANDPHLNIWNIKKDEFIGKSFIDICNSFNVDKDIRSVIESTFGAEQSSEEIKIVVKGKEYHLKLKFIPTIFENDQQAVTIICEDITPQKRAEKMLKIQRDLFITLSSSYDMMEAFNQILETIFKIGEVDGGGIYLVDSTTKELNLIAARGLSHEFTEEVSHYEADAPQTRLVMEGKPLYMPYPKLLPSMTRIFQKENIRTVASIPVLYKGEVVAVLNLASQTHDDISANVRYMIETLALQIGGFIARTRAESAVQGN